MYIWCEEVPCPFEKKEVLFAWKTDETSHHFSWYCFPYQQVSEVYCTMAFSISPIFIGQVWLIPFEWSFWGETCWWHGKHRSWLQYLAQENELLLIGNNLDYKTTSKTNLTNHLSLSLQKKGKHVSTMSFFRKPADHVFCFPSLRVFLAQVVWHVVSCMITSLSAVAKRCDEKRLRFRKGCFLWSP